MKLVENVTKTIWTGRLTKQGLRDLNYHGPRPAKGVAGTPLAPAVANDTGPESEPPVTAAVASNDTSDVG
jgi:hypothetical protein